MVFKPVISIFLAGLLLCVVVASVVPDCGPFGCQFRLDPSYGIHTPIISHGRTVGYGLLLAQNSVYITGSTSTGTDSGTDFYLLRVSDTNGLAVAGFGTNGVVKTDFGFPNGSRTDVATCLEVYNDNIIVGGETVTNVVGGTISNLSFALAMYQQSNGALVPTFGNNGLKTVKLSRTGLNDEIFGITVARGNIYAAGFSNPGSVQGNGPSFHGGAVKMDGYGNLDTTWADNGKIIMDSLGSDERIQSIHVDSMGKTKIVGRIRPLNNPKFQPLLITLSANGQYNRTVPQDQRFYGPGYAVSNLGGNFVTAKSITDGDSTLLVARWDGTHGDGSRYAAAVVKFLPSGEVDTRFGSYGVASMFAPEGTMSGYSLCKNNWHIYVVGSWTLGSTVRPVVVRFHALDGTVDTSFGTKGMYLQDLSGNGFYRDCKINGNDLYVVGEALLPPVTTSVLIHAKYQF